MIFRTGCLYERCMNQENDYCFSTHSVLDCQLHLPTLMVRIPCFITATYPLGHIFHFESFLILPLFPYQYCSTDSHLNTAQFYQESELAKGRLVGCSWRNTMCLIYACEDIEPKSPRKPHASALHLSSTMRGPTAQRVF